MTTTVIRNVTLLATMDAQRREIADGALVIEGNQVAWVGATAELAPSANLQWPSQLRLLPRSN